MVKNSVITGTGSYIPDEVRTNQHFINTTFYTEKGELIDEPGEKVISKFNSITDIEERRYASEDMTCSTIGTFAAEKAIADAGIDPEQLDYIIVAQNFGDVVKHTIQSDMVPSLASRIKQNLKINQSKIRQQLQKTVQSTSPPMPAARAALSVITPLLVDTTAMPRPARTFGSSSRPLYIRNPGELPRCNSSITGRPL